jgi:hypothetical protein
VLQGTVMKRKWVIFFFRNESFLTFFGSELDKSYGFSSAILDPGGEVDFYAPDLDAFKLKVSLVFDFATRIKADIVGKPSEPLIADVLG